MKIVTVNVPESYITVIEQLIGEEGLYPSRSELIRVAVREFLLKEIELAKKMALHNDIVPKEFDLDNENFIRIPKEEEKTEFTTFKVLKRLDSDPNKVKGESKESKKKLRGLGNGGKWKKNPLGNIYHPNYDGPKEL